VYAISYSEARENLKSVMDRAVADSTPVHITRQRGEGVVMISERDWASIEETLYLLRSPRNARELLASIAELDAGEGEVRDLLQP
jgi:antitoxin YefM